MKLYRKLCESIAARIVAAAESADLADEWAGQARGHWIEPLTVRECAARAVRDFAVSRGRARRALDRAL